MNVDHAVQLAIERNLGLALFWVIAVVLAGQWAIMTFMWPRTRPEWAVWSKTTAFLMIVMARLVLFYTGNERFPFPIGAIINGLALTLIVYFGKVYLWDTWIRGRYTREEETQGIHEINEPDHVSGFVDRYWGGRRADDGLAHEDVAQDAKRHDNLIH